MWSGDRTIQIPFGQCKDVDIDLDITTVEVDPIALAELIGGQISPSELTGEVLLHTDFFFPPPVEGDGAYLSPKKLDPHAFGRAKLRAGGTISVDLHKLV